MTTKQPIVYAFIDSQNLNLGIQSQGWKLDSRKFRLYLKNKYHVSKAYIFIGQVVDNEAMYQTFRMAGFKVIFKPTTEFTKDGDITVKGNVDAELVLYSSAILYKDYDKAIIVSGDGDFLCLYDYLADHHKLYKILIPNKKRYSKLLNKYYDYFDFLSTNRKKLTYIEKHQSN